MITREIPNCSPESVLNIHGFKRNFKCYPRILCEVLMRARHIAQQYEKNRYVLFDLVIPKEFDSKYKETRTRVEGATLFFERLSDYILSQYESQIQYVWTHHQDDVYRCLVLERDASPGYRINFVISYFWSIVTGAPMRVDKLDKMIGSGPILNPCDVATGNDLDDQFRHCLTWASYLSQLDVDEGQELHDMKTYGMSRIPGKTL